MNTPAITTTQLPVSRGLILGPRIVVKTLAVAARHCIYRGTLTRFELVWPMQGTVEILPGQSIGGNQLALLVPGKAYLHGTGEQRSRSLHVSFDIESYPEEWGEPGAWPGWVDLADGDICRPLLGYLRTHATDADDRLVRPMLAALLTALISGQTRIAALDVSPVHPVVAKALAYIRGKFDLDPACAFTLGEIARFAGVGANNLCDLFRRRLGDTPMHCIYKARLDRAVELLRTTDFNLTMVAAMTGFGRRRALCRWCGWEFGCPPGELRARFGGGREAWPLPRCPELAGPAVPGHVLRARLPSSGVSSQVYHGKDNDG